MKNFLIIFFFFTTQVVHAQQVTGYWYGQANVEISGIQNNYLTELIIAQKGNKIKGFFGYYFKDVYQTFMVNGSYDPKTRQVIIRDIPIIYYMTNSTVNSVDCMTSFYGTLLVSRVKTQLTGYFLRDKKYTYTCPDLRVNYTLYTEARVEDSIFKDVVNTRTFWKPQANAELAGQQKDQTKQASTVAINTHLDSNTKQIAVNSKVVNSPLTIDPATNRIMEQFKKRKQVLNKEIEVASDSLRLSFYDNGDVDGDSISVFMNNGLIISHQGLSERAFNLYVKLDSSKEVNEISMFAENLGKFPPNTALMVVTDGEKRYEIFLSSDFKGNATVRFKRKNASVARGN